MRPPLALASTAVIFTLACSSSESGPAAQPSVGNRSSAITMEELATMAGLDVFEAVSRLRPKWLRTRGPVSLMLETGVRVHVNGFDRGRVQELRSIWSTDVESIRFLSAPDATTRYGINHANGAIMITLRR
ncbi:MAG: hypothetical protein BMS9Abin29_1360 [Gemmatimonadota bacterium]|nr:MAG: hypothetical protein BMS9Abin29_1360 [Gemmatimonadota bacterium]